MKANQKFVKADEAVSPVIAVILMVAITVVLAATVYVWVSGFGAQSGNPQKSISLTSAAALATVNSTDNVKVYAIASGTSGMKYSDLTITLNGATVPCNDAWPGNANAFRIGHSGSYIACSATNPSNVVAAGDTIELYVDGGSASGQTLRVLDAQANAVMLTLTVG